MAQMGNVLKEITTNPTISRIIIVVVGLIVVFLSVQIIKKSLGKRIRDDNWYKTKKIVNGLGYAIFIIIILTVYSDRLGNIAVALGVASAGIAFALQEVIASMAGWLAIMVSDFYRPGDRVQVGGIKGDVIDLGILRTTVMELGDWIDGDLYNGRIVRIANSFVFKEPVYNYSADFPFLWNEIIIPIKFESNYEYTREVFKKVTDDITGDYAKESKVYWDEMVRKYAIENASLDTMVTMKITDNWVEYTIRYVVNYRKRRSVEDALYTEILRAVNESDGAIQLASVTLNITEFSSKINNKKK
jgi:small-conductance mechanosensitive channel